MHVKGLYRLAAVVPRLRVGNPGYNAEQILVAYLSAVAQGASLVVFPELSLTGSTCGDLFRHEQLLTAAAAGLNRLQVATAGKSAVLVVGLPFPVGARLFNVAAVLQDGCLLGLVGKTYLASLTESLEQRLFSSIAVHDGGEVQWQGKMIPLAQGMTFTDGKFCFAVEIGTDLQALPPPSFKLAQQGAQVICNLAAEPELIGRAEVRRQAVAEQSRRLLAAYLLVNAGVHESTADHVFSGQAVVAVNGKIKAENKRFARNVEVVMTDVKTSWLESRRRNDDWKQQQPTPATTKIALQPLPQTADATYFHLPRNPFVPVAAEDLAVRCQEIFALQASGLAKRLEHCGLQRMILGLSGGLDSTLALLVAVCCCDLLALPRASILAVTMPGPGTTSRTRNNAMAIAGELGVELRVIDIGAAVMGHFHDIGHDPEQLDVVYENAQARERTQILMDLANANGGLVIGTGDLSEVALGWSTFNGDHMSMYGVNGGVPKTLVRHLIRYYADTSAEPELARLLLDVLNTPVSPELLPGEQLTEDVLGSYELHDFFLYHFLRHQENQEGLMALAKLAFQQKYDDKEIQRVLQIFLRRFFSQQFKRNVLPDGPRIGTIGLSPRGIWQMPADFDPDAWLSEG